MAEYVLNRTYVLRSLSGHSVAFEKGVPTFVPNACIREVEAIGGERIDAKNGEGLDEPAQKQEPQGEEREQLILEAFKEIVAKNARDEFTAQGAPHVRALKTLLGFEVDNKERDKVWKKYQAEEGSK